jgi:hypothetical protein
VENHILEQIMIAIKDLTIKYNNNIEKIRLITIESPLFVKFKKSIVERR